MTRRKPSAKPVKVENPEGAGTAPPNPSQEILERLEPFVPAERRVEAAQVVSMMIAQSHSGPLPSPRDFAGYDRALPGTAERILSMAEGEQRHRHGIETTLVTREMGFKSRGQWFAFVGLLVMLGAVLAMALMGHAVAGASLGSAVIIGVVALFLGQKWVSGTNGSVAPAPPPEEKKT